MDYEKTTAILVVAIQELKEELTIKDTKIKDLEKRTEALEAA